MSERKRKLEALSGENADVERKVITPKTDDSNRSSVVVASTGVPAQGGNALDTLPSAGMKSHESSCGTLPPGIIAKIGTYVELSADADDVDKKTLMSSCMAVGPNVASYIRKAYLENNLSYLEYLEETMVRDGANECLSDEECSQTGEKLLQWMLYNPWWRDACRSPTTFNQKEQEGKVPTICKQINIKPFASVAKGEEFFDNSINSASGHIAIPLELCENARIEKPFDEKYNVVMTVNGNSYWISNVSEFADEILASDREKEIYVMHGSFDLFFSNPVLSINLGLLDLLRFQLEELKLDVNFQGWRGPRLGDVELPPIFYSMIQPDGRFFKYLLSIDGIVLNPPILRCPITNRDMRNPWFEGMSLLHYLSFITGMILNGKFNMDRLKIFLSKDGIDINGGPPFPHAAGNLTPLYFLFCTSLKFDSDFDFVRAFVEAGADVGYTLSIASSDAFEMQLERGLSMTLQSIRETYQSRDLDSTLDGISAEATLSRHRTLVALLQKLKDEKEK